MIMKLAKALMTFLLVLVAGTLQAGTITLTGNTTGDPTWNRPTAGTPPTTLSSPGTAVPYEDRPFVVDISGLYSLETILPTAFDTYLFL